MHKVEKQRVPQLKFQYENQFLAVWAAWRITEKKTCSDYEQLLRAVFLCFHGQKIGLTYF